MPVKPSLIIGFAAGYVLGARAGRERYDSIMRQARAVQERPEVQSVAGVVSAQASMLRDRVRETVGGRSASPSSRPFTGSPDAHSVNGLGSVSPN
jgi:hypothetical protein